MWKTLKLHRTRSKRGVVWICSPWNTAVTVFPSPSVGHGRRARAPPGRDGGDVGRHDAPKRPQCRCSYDCVPSRTKRRRWWVTRFGIGCVMCFATVSRCLAVPPLVLLNSWDKYIRYSGGTHGTHMQRWQVHRRICPFSARSLFSFNTSEWDRKCDNRLKSHRNTWPQLLPHRLGHAIISVPAAKFGVNGALIYEKLTHHCKSIGRPTQRTYCRRGRLGTTRDRRRRTPPLLLMLLRRRKSLLRTTDRPSRPGSRRPGQSPGEPR